VADTVQAVPERLAPLADKAAPPLPAPPPAAPRKTVVASDEPPLPPLPSVPPSSAAAAVPQAAYAPPVPMPPAAPVAVAALAPPLPAAADPAKSDASRIVLRAKSDAWIQVRDRSGQILLNRVLRNGETWPVPAKPSLLLTTGNAGGTEVLVDGTATASLGGDGAVRRDLPLDADAIKDGKLAPLLKHP